MTCLDVRAWRRLRCLRNAARSLVARVLLASALIIGGASAANAQSTFNFAFTFANGNSVAGLFVANHLGGSQFQITNIVGGLQNGNPISLVAPGQIGGVGVVSDNVLVSTTPPFFNNLGGFGYFVPADSTTYIISASGGSVIQTSVGGTGSSNALTESVTQVPLPLAGAGLLSYLVVALGIALARYRWLLRNIRVLMSRTSGRSQSDNQGISSSPDRTASMASETA